MFSFRGGIFYNKTVVKYNEGMELNYDLKEKTCCPKVDCHKKCGCKCGLTFVSVPAQLTEKMAPKNGLYCNSIVVYEGTGEVYLFSKEGIPVKVKEGA